jgi:hypothetical protein
MVIPPKAGLTVKALSPENWGQVYFVSNLFYPQEKSFGEDLRGRLKN